MRWPCSSRCSVAIREPWLPSTSTQAWSASGSSQGRPKATNGAPRSWRKPGLRRPGVGVGDDEGVDGGRAEQVVVAVERVVGVAGEQQHVVTGARGGLGQAVQEPVHQRVAGALLGLLEAQPDQVRGAGAQLAGGPVGRVAEPVDHRLHPDEGLGPQQLGVVQRVGDRLPRDARGVGHRGKRRRHRVARPLYVGPAARLAHGTPRSVNVPIVGHRVAPSTSRRVLSVPSPSVLVMAQANTRSNGKAPRPGYHCNECGWETGKWVGRCGECQAWGTVVEKSAPKSRVQAGPVTAPARPIGEVRDRGLALAHQRRPRARPGARRRAGPRSGDPARRRARGRQVHAAARGGRPDGPAAAPRPLRHRRGVGRPGADARRPHRRASRPSSTSPPRPTSAPCSATSRRSSRPCWSSTRCRPSAPSDVDGVPGGVTQVKEVSAALIRMAKLRNITLVIIGHVTKDGSIAGPRVLEHLVDVVLHFEGERTSRLRMLRAMKNRYGPVDEVGCFDLSAEGIVAITDPTGLFLDARHGPVPGTCVAVAMEGRRPLLSEVQALVTPSAAERPRRTTSGVDQSRVAMILAVLQQHAGVRLHQPRRVRLQRRRRPAHRAEQRRGHRAGDHLGLAAPAAGPQRGGHRRARPLRRAAARPRRRHAPRRGRPDGLPLRRWSPPSRRRASATAASSTACGWSTSTTSRRALNLLGLEKDGGARGRAVIDSARGFPRACRRRSPPARDAGRDRPRHLPARRARADPARPHRRADRAGSRQARSRAS